MNDGERRELEQFAAEHVADGIVRFGAAGMSEGERRSFVEKLAREAIDEAARSMVEGAVTTPTVEEEEQIVRRLVASQLGLGRLQLLLDEDDIENININGADRVWVKRADGIKEQVDPIADSDEELIELVQRAARAHHTGGERRIDSAKPIVDLHLAGGHRLSAMIEVSDRPCVSIRRHRLVDPTLSDLADSITDELGRFLTAAVRARLNLIVSGGTDAGKTTLLRALAAEADPADRIVTIELSYELGLHELPHRHPDCVGWETREANTEGQGAVSMEYLVQRANRHDADRVIVGEVLGDEIVPMLNAMTAGKAGSMCTIHADSTEGTFGKIKTYACQSPKHLSDDAAAQLTAQALDLVVFVRKRPDASGLARRYVSSVRVVEDADGPHVISTEIFAEPDGGGPAVLHLGMPPGLRDRLADFGYEAPLQVGVRPMTPVVVLIGAGIGVGLALVVSGFWSTGAPVRRMSMTKRLDPANRQAALCAVVLALIVGLITRWPVGAAIGGAVGWTLRSPSSPTPPVGSPAAWRRWPPGSRRSGQHRRPPGAAGRHRVHGADGTTIDPGQRGRPGRADQGGCGPGRCALYLCRRAGRCGRRRGGGPAHAGQSVRRSDLQSLLATAAAKPGTRSPSGSASRSPGPSPGGTCAWSSP